MGKCRSIGRTKVEVFRCTFINAAAEAALEATAPVDELHVGTHVGFASVAADRPHLAVVHHRQGRLQREANAEAFSEMSTARPIGSHSINTQTKLAALLHKQHLTGVKY